MEEEKDVQKQKQQEDAELDESEYLKDEFDIYVYLKKNRKAKKTEPAVSD